MFDRSFNACNPRWAGEGKVDDPEFDLQGHDAYRFGHHSWRRFADKIARDNQDFHELSPQEIDLYAGWNQKEHDHDMQQHYAGQDRKHRIKRRNLTRMA